LRNEDDFCNIEENFEKGIDSVVDLKQVKKCFQNQRNKKNQRTMFNYSRYQIKDWETVNKVNYTAMKNFAN
jgi:hypothetical protein